MIIWIDLLIWRCWWQWPGRSATSFDWTYRSLNLVEGAIWLLLGALVLLRFLKHRQSRLEIAYATAFVLFGFTDFLETRSLHSWLIWLKAIVLVSLLVLRRVVIRRFYPTSRTY
jgi:hypothetical protein